MLQLASRIEPAAAIVKNRWSTPPQTAVVLGSGHGDLVEVISIEEVIDYSEIPLFPQVSALGHRGRLLCGRLAGVPIVAFQGRFHLYEGLAPQETVLPVWLAKALGVNTLISTNAAGGLNPVFSVGDIMLIEDQINLTFANPLLGNNQSGLGPRFCDMSQPYDRELNKVALTVAQDEGFSLHRGVYVAVLGPNYETRAEYRMLRRLGGDAVGMSTVGEVVAARHAGMRVVGLSTITNVCSPDVPDKTLAQTVIQVAATATGRLGKILQRLLEPSM